MPAAAGERNQGRVNRPVHSSLPRVSAGRYSIIVSLELVTVVLIGVAVIGERLAPVQFIGVGLVCVGIVADRLIRANR